MSEQFSRTELLIGEEAVKNLANCRVAVFGVGGVGGYVCEALVRSGVGAFDLIDSDTVALSNLNRQIIATHSTVGRYKTEVMKERMLDINPDVDVTIHNCFFLPENADDFPFDSYDYVVDAVDTVTAKIALVMKAKEHNVPIISSMGAGNKLNPALFQVKDIYKTQVCPLAKVMRRELKKRGIKKLKVVYSEEIPLKPREAADQANDMVESASTTPAGDIKNTTELTSSTPETTTKNATNHPRRSTPGSVAFVPSVAGLILASEVVKDLIHG